MILRLVGQNGGGSRVYVYQLNNELLKHNIECTTFYKYKNDSDPLTDNKICNQKIYYGFNICNLFLYTFKNKSKIEFIHTHLRNATVIGMLLCSFFNMKHIITVHGPIIYGKEIFKDKIIKIFFKLAMLKSHKVIFISNFTKKNTLKLCNIKQLKQSKVIYNGSNKNINKINDNYSEKINIVICGELTDRKRPLEVLKLIRILPHEINKNINFHVYGEGPLKDILNRAVLDERINNLILHGNEFDAHKIYNNKDFHLIFSYNEGFGRVITEAMSYNIPTIAYNSGAFPEIINNNVDGWIFNNINECKKILLNISNSIYDIEQIKKNMQIKYNEHFTESKFAQNTINFLFSD